MSRVRCKITGKLPGLKDLQTAEEVRENARLVERRLREQRRKPAIERVEPPKLPEPKPKLVKPRPAEPLEPKPISIGQMTVIGIVARHYGVRPEDVVGPRRLRMFVTPRQVAAYVSRELLKRSSPQIGRKLNRDHSTILHAIERIEREAVSDPGLRAKLDDIMGEIEARIAFIERFFGVSTTATENCHG